MQAAWEKLSLALKELTSSAPIKQRLVVAFEMYLEDLETENLSAPVRQQYTDLVYRMTRIPGSRIETSVQATVRKMSNLDAEACGALVLQMLVTLHREALVSAGPPAEVVPLRAAEG